MKFFLLAFFLTIFVPNGHVFAHVPVLVEQESLHDITFIQDPSLSQGFYGTLSGMPHTYEIRAKENFLLSVEVLVPDIETAKNTVSSIIIRESGRQGKVTEVSRILAKDASWESFYESWGGNSYRKGGAYTEVVGPGVYRIEISTPDNDSPYVLVVGTREEFGTLGYFELLKRLIAVKHFFGQSAFAVIVSPLVYGPLALVLTGAGVFWMFYMKRRKARVGHVE